MQIEPTKQTPQAQPVVPTLATQPIPQAAPNQWFVTGTDETVQAFSRDRRDEELARQAVKAAKILAKREREAALERQWERLERQKKQLERQRQRSKRRHRRRHRRGRGRSRNQGRQHDRNRVINIEHRRHW
jgi:hypothetical protein